MGAQFTFVVNIGESWLFPCNFLSAVASFFVFVCSSSSDLLGLFAVESPSGRVTLQKSGLDYEQHVNYTVTVNSTDSGYPPYSVTGSFVVNVRNANEQPQNISLTANKVMCGWRLKSKTLLKIGVGDVAA